MAGRRFGQSPLCLLVDRAMKRRHFLHGITATASGLLLPATVKAAGEASSAMLLARIQGGGEPVYDPAAEAFFVRQSVLGVPVSDGRKTLLNAVFASLRTAGLLSILDVLQIHASENGTTGRQNLIQDLYNSTAVNSPTFTVDRGYAGNGTSSYLNTNFNPSVVVGANFVRNSASMGLYSRTSRASVNAADMGASNTVKTFIKPDSTIATPTPGFQFAGNENAASSDGVHHGSLGHFAGSRTGASAVALYFNGAQTATSTTASTGITDGNIFICCFNFNNAWNNGTTDQIAYAFIGGGMTAQNVSDLTTILQTYLTAVGA